MIARVRHVAALLAALALLVPALARAVAAQDTGWQITGYHANYRIIPNRSIEVVERIDVDFGPLQRHGIYREIPVRYRKVLSPGVPITTGKVSTELTVERVTDAQDVALPTKVERTDGGNRVRIRIGDPDRLVSGKQSYILFYRLGSGLGFFKDHDELYWQVTGTEWPVPILQAVATVTIAAPTAAAHDSGWSAWCYAGWSESSSNDRCTAQVLRPGTWRFASGRLEPGEGLTMVAGFPKGVIAAPSAADKLAALIRTWWPAGLPILALLVLGYLYWTRGREPAAGSIVPVWRPPPGLPPGAAGALVDQRADMKDIVATLIDLAVRGYVQIKEVPLPGIGALTSDHPFLAKALKSLGMSTTDWELERTSKPTAPDELAPYEMSVLNGIFDGSSTRRMSDLHNEFYRNLPGIRKGMYGYLVEHGYFRRSPEAVRSAYGVVGGLVLFAGAWVGIMAQNLVFAACAVLAAIIVFLFRSAMPAMTVEGARRWRDVKGLEEYIRRAEKAELESRQAPEKTTQLFETLLPYAIALDVSDIWVKQFATVLASAPPTWYTGTTPGHFSTGHFQSGLASFQTAATRTLGSAPGSSSGGGGGGSVGGGGGGGGGGSW